MSMVLYGNSITTVKCNDMAELSKRAIYCFKKDTRDTTNKIIETGEMIKGGKVRHIVYLYFCERCSNSKKGLGFKTMKFLT